MARESGRSASTAIKCLTAPPVCITSELEWRTRSAIFAARTAWVRLRPALRNLARGRVWQRLVRPRGWGSIGNGLRAGLATPDRPRRRGRRSRDDGRRFRAADLGSLNVILL